MNNVIPFPTVKPKLVKVTLTTHNGATFSTKTFEVDSKTASKVSRWKDSQDNKYGGYLIQKREEVN